VITIPIQSPTRQRWSGGPLRHSKARRFSLRIPNRPPGTAKDIVDAGAAGRKTATAKIRQNIAANPALPTDLRRAKKRSWLVTFALIWGTLTWEGENS
jgi:hypothetical protein